MTYIEYYELIESLIAQQKAMSEDQETVTVFWRDTAFGCYATTLEVSQKLHKTFGGDEWVALAAVQQFTSKRPSLGSQDPVEIAAHILGDGYDLMYIIKGAPEYLV